MFPTDVRLVHGLRSAFRGFRTDINDTNEWIYLFIEFRLKSSGRSILINIGLPWVNFVHYRTFSWILGNEPHHHHHLSLNREGRWSTTNDFTTSFFYFSLFSTTALWHLANSRPVHSLMLSSHLFLCLPCRPAINLCLTYSGQSVVSVNSALSEFDSNPGSFQHRPHKWGKKSKRNLFGRCPASCVAVRYYAGRLLKRCLLDFIPRLQLREVWSLKKNNHTKTKTVIQSMVIFRKFEAKSLMLANSPHHFRLISP